MKTTDKFLSAAVLTAAALCASCSTDDLTAQQEQAETKAVSLTATLGETPTRAGINKRSGNTHTLYWHEDDALSVQTTSDGTFSNAKFAIATGTATGVTSATFKGAVDNGVLVGSYAVYPYNKNHKFTGEAALTYNLPATYTYTTVESGIFPKDGVFRTTNTCVPMFGKIDNNQASFKHLGGLAVIRIDKMPGAAGEIVVTASGKLSGNFEVADLSVDNPVIATASTSTAADKQVTFEYSGAKKGCAGVFYLPLAIGQYTDLTISVDGKDATYGTLNVARADLIAIPVYQGTDGTSYSCTYEMDGHKFIDLCLPSGTLWAETNVGATNAADYGNYYAWGEVETKSLYQWGTYRYGHSYSNLTKYNSSDSRMVLDKEDDAAYMNWGSFCRTPTYQEFTELCNTDYCTWTWTSKTASDNETFINGYEVKSEKNGKSIFLPASGRYSEGNNDVCGQRGCYWSSTRQASSDVVAYDFYFTESSNKADSYSEYKYGFSVRPVAKPYNSTVPDLTISGMDSGWE